MNFNLGDNDTSQFVTIDHMSVYKYILFNFGKNGHAFIYIHIATADADQVYFFNEAYFFGQVLEYNGYQQACCILENKENGNLVKQKKGKIQDINELEFWIYLNLWCESEWKQTQVILITYNQCKIHSINMNE